MNKTSFTLLILFLGLLPTVNLSAAEKPSRPNVVLVMTDDQGYLVLTSSRSFHDRMSYW